MLTTWISHVNKILALAPFGLERMFAYDIIVQPIKGRALQVYLSLPDKGWHSVAAAFKNEFGVSESYDSIIARIHRITNFNHKLNRSPKTYTPRT